MFARTLLLLFCGLAFWAGTEVQLALMNDRCRNAGGSIDPAGICRGVP